MGFVTDVKRWFVDDLCREPKGGRWSWFTLGLGILTVAYGSASLLLEGVGAHFLLLGAAFATMGAAELVPGDRIRSARNLRIASWVAFVLYLAVVAGPPLLAAGTELRIAVAAGLLFLAAYGWLMYEILRE